MNDFGIIVDETDTMHSAVILLKESAILVPESGFVDKKTKTNILKKIQAWIKNIVRYIKKFYYTAIARIKNEFLGGGGIMTKLPYVLALDEEILQNLPSFYRPRVIEISYDVLEKMDTYEPYMDVYGDFSEIKSGLNRIIGSLKKNDLEGALEISNDLAQSLIDDRYEGGRDIDHWDVTKSNLEYVIIEDRLRFMTNLHPKETTEELLKGDPKAIESAALNGILEGMVKEKGISRQHTKNLFLRLMNMYNIVNDLKIAMIDMETLFYKFERLADKKIRRIENSEDRAQLNSVHVLWSILNTMYSGNMKALRVGLQVHHYCTKVYENTLKLIIEETKPHFMSREESIQILKDRGEYEEFLNIEVQFKKKNKEKDVDPSIIS